MPRRRRHRRPHRATTARNKTIVRSRLRPRFATRNEYLLVVVVEQNLVGISAGMLGVLIAAYVTHRSSDII